MTKVAEGYLNTLSKIKNLIMIQATYRRNPYFQLTPENKIGKYIICICLLFSIDELTQ